MERAVTTGTAALGNDQRAIAAFVARELGCEATRVARVDAFATNAVYEVDAGGLRLIVKASAMQGAIRAEAWACARGADAGCAAPEILRVGRLGTGDSMSVLVMRRVAGRPIAAGHPGLREVGIRLRRLHETRLAGFGWLAEASWDERGGCSLPHRSWPAFLKGICRDAHDLADRRAVSVAEAASTEIDAHADALAAVEGSLCHGDLKPSHIFVDSGRLSGVIDWGDAVSGDPLWDIARFAHRTDAESLSLLLEGYDPDRGLAGEIEWRLPLYEALWILFDAVVAHRLGLGAKEDA
jgi:Ser/Thr protein kinase RdoA (MazF antagonist)